MGRDEAVASLGPRHYNTNHSNTARVESRRLYRQALKGHKEITDSSQNYTEA